MTGTQDRWERLRMALAMLLVGCLWIGCWFYVLNYLGPLGQKMNVVFFDSGFELFPVTIQNFMWLVFFLGIGEVVLRRRLALLEEQQLSQKYLPEDESTILHSRDLPVLYKKVRQHNSDGLFLPGVILRIVAHYQSNPSIGQSHALLNSDLELRSHEIELSYTMARYIVWLIPTLGFIGTVVGIAMAMDFLGNANLRSPTLLAEVTRKLAVAFNTTLVGLLQSAVLVLFMNLVQEREERAINHAGRYCLDNLLNRFLSNNSN